MTNTGQVKCTNKTDTIGTITKSVRIQVRNIPGKYDNMAQQKTTTIDNAHIIREIVL